jgi:hypothetical protein
MGMPLSSKAAKASRPVNLIIVFISLEHVPPELNLRGFPWGD